MCCQHDGHQFPVGDNVTVTSGNTTVVSLTCQQTGGGPALLAQVQDVGEIVLQLLSYLSNTVLFLAGMIAF